MVVSGATLVTWLDRIKSFLRMWPERPYEPKPRYPGGLKIAYESSAKKEVKRMRLRRKTKITKEEIQQIRDEMIPLYKKLVAVVMQSGINRRFIMFAEDPKLGSIVFYVEPDLGVAVDILKDKIKKIEKAEK